MVISSIKGNDEVEEIECYVKLESNKVFIIRINFE